MKYDQHFIIDSETAKKIVSFLDIKKNEKVLEIINDLSAEDATFNIVGQESINLAIRAGLIKKKNVKTIEGVPFALVLL